MSTTTTTARPEARRAGPATVAAASPPAPTADAPTSSMGSRQEPVHEPGDLHDLAHLLAAPLRGRPEHRARVDRALALLLGPDGVDAPHLLPTRHTPDVVRHRIAGRALSGLVPRDATHRHLVAGALAILRG